MKRLTLFLLLLTAAFVFTSCGKNEDPDKPGRSSVETDTVDITVVTSYGVDDGNRQNYEHALMAYESSSGNTVRDLSEVSNEDWKSRVISGFENGEEPDVLFFFTGADSNSFISANKVVSIDEIRSVYPDYASNMKDNMLPKSPFDGKSYAVPVNGYWEGLYVNKRVLADCGVDIPDENTTWENFLADCQTIADKGYIPIAASLNEVPHYWFEYCVLNNGSPADHLTLPESADDYMGRIWAAGLNDIKDLYERGFFPENTLTASAAETDLLMTENRAAFLIEGSWKMGWFAENASDINNFTVTYVPAGTGGRRPTDMIGGLSMGYFITRQAWDNPEKREACIEFITAMTSDEVVQTFGITAMNALKNPLLPPSDANNFVRDALQTTTNASGFTEAAADNLLPAARAKLFAGVKNIVTGNATAADIINLCLE